MVVIYKPGQPAPSHSSPRPKPQEYSAEHFQDPLRQQIKEPWWSKLLRDKKKLTLIIILASAAVAGIIIWIVIRNSLPIFSGKKVFLEISAPSALASGSEITYRINCVNKEEVALKEAEVELILPPSFQYQDSSWPSEDRRTWSLGRIEPNASKDFTLTGTLSGVADEASPITGTMRFVPEGINSSFAVEAAALTVISAGDLTLTIDAPQSTASGNDIEYLIRYENRSSDKKENLVLRLTYPDGFSFVSAQPAATSANNQWQLPALAGGSNGQVKINGRLTGVSNEAKRVIAELGTTDAQGNFLVQLRKEDSTRVMQSAIVLAQTINGQKQLNVNTGEKLDFLIDYENQGGVALKNVSIVVEVNPELIDFSAFNSKGGNYSNGKITWNSTGIPELSLIQPAQKGSVSFTTKVKNRQELPVKSAGDKNLKIIAKAFLQSDDIPIEISANRQVGAEAIEAKLNSYLELGAYILYYNQMDGQPLGSGPMPPRVNQKTTYRYFLEVTNYTNDVNEAKVICALPPGVKYEGNDTISHGQDLTYDSKTGQITWLIGKIPANQGFKTEKMLASFNISITPGEDKVGQELPLMKTSDLSGQDSFTGVGLKGNVGELNTNLKKSDKFFRSEDSKVVK